MSISTGAYTIGTGGDYATVQAFLNDIAAALTGNLTGTVISNITETTAIAKTLSLAGFTLNLTADTSPLGNPNAGHILSINHNGDFLNVLPNSGSAGIINFTKLNIKRITSPAASKALMYIYPGPVAGSVCNVNDCCLNIGGYGSWGIVTQAANWTVNMFNIKIFNGTGIGLYTYDLAAASKIENLTIHNCGTGLSGNNKSCVKKNIAAFANATADYVNASTGTFEKCASGDTSGSEAGLRSLVTADQFISTTITDSTYLRAKSTGALAGAGVAPGIAANIIGARGNVRPHIG